MTNDSFTKKVFTLDQQQYRRITLIENPNASLNQLQAIPIWLNVQNKPRPLVTYFDYAIKKQLEEQN